jgi:hypothetical protein
MQNKINRFLKKNIKFYDSKPRFKYSPKELKVGIKIEKEHTKNKKQ